MGVRIYRDDPCIYALTPRYASQYGLVIFSMLKCSKLRSSTSDCRPVQACELLLTFASSRHTATRKACKGCPWKEENMFISEYVLLIYNINAYNHTYMVRGCQDHTRMVRGCQDHSTVPWIRDNQGLPPDVYRMDDRRLSNTWTTIYRTDSVLHLCTRYNTIQLRPFLEYPWMTEASNLMILYG
jgi:hypothetical protein